MILMYRNGAQKSITGEIARHWNGADNMARFSARNSIGSGCRERRFILDRIIYFELSLLMLFKLAMEQQF